MRQTLSKGMVVAAAAATGILSMYGTPAFADSQANGAAADSPGVASGNNVQVPVGVPVNACGNSVDVVGGLNPSFGNSCANGSSSHGAHGSHGAPHHSSHHGSSHHGSGHHGGSGYGDSGYGGSGYGDTSGSHGHSGSSTHGGTHGSPGVGTGNDTEAPVDVPVNACGDTVDVIGVGNPVFGNECGGGHQGYGEETPPHSPPRHHPHTPPHHPPHTPPGTTPHTPPSTGPGTPPVTRTVTPPGVPPTTRVTTPPSTPTEAGPSLAHTGSDDVLAAAAASAGLLISGTVLYRRGRSASRR